MSQAEVAASRYSGEEIAEIISKAFGADFEKLQSELVGYYIDAVNWEVKNIEVCGVDLETRNRLNLFNIDAAVWELRKNELVKFDTRPSSFFFPSIFIDIVDSDGQELSRIKPSDKISCALQVLKLECFQDGSPWEVVLTCKAIGPIDIQSSGL